MSDNAIELRRLTRYFSGRAVIRDLDFVVPTGRVTALLGLNGAGKTTTIRILMGLLAPTRGQAITLGEPAMNLPIETRARIGYAVEGHFLYPSMRVQQCRDFQRSGHASWDDRLFNDIVQHFAIDPSARVATLSRGQRAGVSLALVLAPNPDLLVLDDPALGLDPVSRRALNETLIEFAGSGGRTVLLSSHLLDDVERIADRVAVMVGGRLKVDASMDEFRSRVSAFVVRADSFDPARIAAVPGLVEARRWGDRMTLTLADRDSESDAALARLGAEEIEPVDLNFSDAVLSYLTRERADGSFFSTPLAANHAD
ncbi:ABC transporter ATP-binding protein [Roseiconus nitratireducens]|uniref:ABC transporter ATP-binding protein n=1 Tax=Roseiconus nitratireducens TaxID=2605748 RepID=A0A5M6DCE6_9BACT|nr:ABC transporter ATP-binding protein [Roseiconus nitratireducens]KAA5543759.1 ABC transporter ATP-binding protein [Roseiconus nitratireducens]